MYLVQDLWIKRNENCALLGYYTASTGNFLPAFRNNLQVPSSVFKNTKKTWNHTQSTVMFETSPISTVSHLSCLLTFPQSGTTITSYSCDDYPKQNAHTKFCYVISAADISYVKLNWGQASSLNCWRCDERYFRKSNSLYLNYSWFSSDPWGKCPYHSSQTVPAYVHLSFTPIPTGNTFNIRLITI